MPLLRCRSIPHRYAATDTKAAASDEIHHFAYLFQLMSLLFRFVSVEHAKVQMASAMIDVILHKPSARLNICVPRKDRLVRMAIITRAAEYLRDIGWDRNGGFECVRLNDRRICLINPEKLDYHEPGEPTATKIFIIFS